MLAPAAQPTVDRKNSSAHACCSGRTCQPKATCAGAGADPRERARPLKCWPPRLLRDTVSHCEIFFSSPVGGVPSVRKCVTALQKQRLSETVPPRASVVHVCCLTNAAYVTPRMGGGVNAAPSSAPRLNFGDQWGSKGTLDL